MKRMSGILAVLLTVPIMKEELTFGFLARGATQYRPLTRKKEVRNKKKDTTKCVVGEKAPKWPCSWHGGVRKQRENKNM